jgi:hypothetical protein
MYNFIPFLVASIVWLVCLPVDPRSRGSSDSIVSDYGLDDRAIGVQCPTGAKDFSSNLCVQTSSEAHPASYTMGTGVPLLRQSAAGVWCWPLSPSSAEVKNE